MLRRARAVWRHARSLPVLAPLLREVDRWWWTRTIEGADVVDLDYVRAQGGPRSARAAIRRYTRTGYRTGFALNPLFMERLVSSQLPDAGRVPAMYAYLVSDAVDVEVSIAWDAPEYARRTPSAYDAPGRVLGHAWRAGGTIALRGAGRDVEVDTDRVRYAVSEAAAGHLGTDVPPIDGGAVVARLAADEGLPARPLDEARRAADALGCALVVAIERGALEASTAAALLSLARRDTFVVRDGVDLLGRVEKAVSPGSGIVVRGPHAEISADDLQRLFREAPHGTVAPLWLGWDGAIFSAGIGVREGRAFHLLAGMPSEDAQALGPVLRPWRTAGDTFAWVAGDGREASPRTLTDALVRAPADDRGLPAPPSGTPDTDVEALASARGWHISTWSARGPVFLRQPAIVRLPDGRRVPSLRWALKIAAPPGPPGEAWGDTHFARGLAESLRRLGQEVVIDAYAARSRTTSSLDDVILALRGPEPLLPQSDALSLLWIISHPDELVAADLRGFDAVFAASKSWAEDRTAAWGRLVSPLLQCTDVQRFRPHCVPRGDRLVFVGTARGIARPSVVEPVRAGLPVDVYGPDWRGYIPSSAIRASGVPNADLPHLYESARAVLNDHWPAMQQHGFVSNRLFDVVAAGGRAVSDDVAGIDALFGGAVITYRSVPEMLDLLEKRLDDAFPSDQRLAQIAADVRRDHSFDARADTLLQTVLKLRQ